MFRKLSPIDMFLRIQDFFELRDIDIEEIRESRKNDHSDFSEWMTMNEREELLKECISRLI